MAKQAKGSKKIDRARGSSQNKRYILERRHARSHLTKVREHIRAQGVTGEDVIAACNKWEDALALKRTTLQVAKRSA